MCCLTSMVGPVAIARRCSPCGCAAQATALWPSPCAYVSESALSPSQLLAAHPSGRATAHVCNAMQCHAAGCAASELQELDSHGRRGLSRLDWRRRGTAPTRAAECARGPVPLRVLRRLIASATLAVRRKTYTLSACVPPCRSSHRPSMPTTTPRKCALRLGPSALCTEAC